MLKMSFSQYLGIIVGVWLIILLNHIFRYYIPIQYGENEDILIYSWTYAMKFTIISQI